MSNSVSLKAIADDYPGFCERIKARLQVGAREYGDASFERPISELIEEVQQELLDVSGWSFIAWQRLERIKAAFNASIAKAEGPAKILEFPAADHGDG